MQKLTEGGSMSQLAKRLNARLVIVPMLAALAALVGACLASPPPPGAVQQNAPPTPQFSTTKVPDALQAAPEQSPLVAASDCPGLDSALAQIIGSPDPIAQARQLQLTVKDDKIQVVLVLAQPDASFLQSFDVEIGGQAENRVQAFVPPGQLCPLAQSGKVLAISVPAQAVPQ
jgi:hypothetical protein